MHLAYQHGRSAQLFASHGELYFMWGVKYYHVMKRMGRPPTGHKPKLSIRMEPAALRLANERAKAQRKTVGTWLEEAIREKAEREAEESNDGSE